MQENIYADGTRSLVSLKPQQQQKKRLINSWFICNACKMKMHHHAIAKMSLNIVKICNRHFRIRRNSAFLHI